MDLQLAGKSAIVTGASRGLGFAIARSLAREGCNLVICDRTADELQAAAADLRAEGVGVEGLQLDITDAGAGDALVGAAREKYGRLDVFVGNAGGNRRGKFVETSDDDWEAILDLNLKAHIRTSRAAVPLLKSSGQGAITFISSIFGRESGGAGLSIYNTTKSALISLSKVMAAELAADGVRVNSVAPGSIRFEGGSWDRRVKEQPEKMKQFVADNIPMGRFGRADEIGDVVAFLSSPRASWISGACLNVDGVQSHSLI
ncbi:MAG: SDR family oxidoreductase [Rhodothermales bacterium]|nr:SDR family oxidoreductase [Rhodothermales bacterium]